MHFKNDKRLGIFFVLLSLPLAFRMLMSLTIQKHQRRISFLYKLFVIVIKAGTGIDSFSNAAFLLLTFALRQIPGVRNSTTQ